MILLVPLNFGCGGPCSCGEAARVVECGGLGITDFSALLPVTMPRSRPTAANTSPKLDSTTPTVPPPAPLARSSSSHPLADCPDIQSPQRNLRGEPYGRIYCS